MPAKIGNSSLSVKVGSFAISYLLMQHMELEKFQPQDRFALPIKRQQPLYHNSLRAMIYINIDHCLKRKGLLPSRFKGWDEYLRKLHASTQKV